MGKSFTEKGSRENGKREFANSFKFFHKGKDINVVVDGRKNRIKKVFWMKVLGELIMIVYAQKKVVEGGGT